MSGRSYGPSEETLKLMEELRKQIDALSPEERQAQLARFHEERAEWLKLGPKERLKRKRVERNARAREARRIKKDRDAQQRDAQRDDPQK